MEFVNVLILFEIPPHEFNLNIGFVMLLRNINPSQGLCNGTRLIVKRLMPNVINADIITGNTKGRKISFHEYCLQLWRKTFLSSFKAGNFPKDFYCYNNKQPQNDNF